MIQPSEESTSPALTRKAMTVLENATPNRVRSPWIDIAVRVVAGALVLAIAFLVYTLVTSEQRKSEDTPASRAVENLIAIVREDPNNLMARLTLADALAAAGRSQEAAEQYLAVLEVSPDDTGALTGLALLAMDQGEWRTAEGYWRQIIEKIRVGPYANTDLRLEKAYYYLASTLMEVGDYEEAAYYLREALEIRSDASDSHFLLAIAYREIGSDTKFREELEIALQFDPHMPEANYEKGLVLLEEGDVAEAAERFRVSAEGAPPWETRPLDELEKLGPVEDRLAEAEEYQAAGDSVAALVSARIAAAVDPDNLEALRLVGTLYEAEQDYERALAAYQRLQSLAPADAEAESAVERLRGLVE